MIEAAASELAPAGVLRAAINLGNFLLVTGRGPAGEPQGVAPDMAAGIARRLGVALQLVPFPNPGAVADAATKGAWDIALIGADPLRAEHIAFSPAYVEIEASYIVPEASPLRRAAEADRAGVRIAVAARSAYDLWLERNIRHATLVRSDTIGGAAKLFVEEGLEALAGLRPGLIGDLERLPGTRILEGRFMAVQQAVGTQRANIAATTFLSAFVEEAKASGLVASLIERHKVSGRLTVAPPL